MKETTMNKAYSRIGGPDDSEIEGLGEGEFGMEALGDAWDVTAITDTL